MANSRATELKFVSCRNGLLSLGAVTRDELLRGQFTDTNHIVDTDNAETTQPPAVNRGAADAPYFGDLAERVEFLRSPQSRYVEVSHDSIIGSGGVARGSAQSSQDLSFMNARLADGRPELRNR